MTAPSRRTFIKTAGLLASATVAGTSACTTESLADRAQGGKNAPEPRERTKGFDDEQLRALAEAVLPATLGADGQHAATAAFVSWADGYDPVAEEMHGYGYSDVRYLPADPSPAWRAQLDALDTLAQRTKGKRFAALDRTAREEVLSAVLRRERNSDRLPAPLGASHIAIALLAHWASSPDAWNLALGVRVSPGACRTLDGATRKPLPIAAVNTGATS